LTAWRKRELLRTTATDYVIVPARKLAAKYLTSSGHSALSNFESISPRTLLQISVLGSMHFHWSVTKGEGLAISRGIPSTYPTADELHQTASIKVRGWQRQAQKKQKLLLSARGFEIWRK
jgi:hypothetical protein